MLRAVALGAVPQVLARNGIPFILAPTGTMANNGAITLGTALPTTYANAYINLPASAISAGSSAGWYFCQMSSTTVGTVFNNTYTSGVPTIPASPTAFATTGPGAYTGVTSAVTGPQISVPAATLGANGSLRIEDLWSVPSNTNTKTLNLTVGGTTIWSAPLSTTANFGAYALHQIWNRGALNANVSVNSNAPSGVGNAVAANTFSSINFASAQTVAFGGQLAVATDFIVIEGYMIEVIP